jgi:drug/metabolite transporter (DMT)-like permease
MTPETDHAESVRALRQLRRIRTFYAGGAALWAASAASAGWDDPGSRQMWIAVVFLMVFTTLLSMTSLWLWRQQAARSDEPGHHAPPRKTAWRRHANA